MLQTNGPLSATLPRDLTSGLVVFLVALPLCLGVALASGAPLFSGVLAGIVGGILVGMLSGSHTSVSGPAAGLTAIVAAQIAVARIVPGVPAGGGARGADPDRPGARPGRVHRCLLPVQRHQGPAGRHRRDPDSETDPPRLRPRPRPGRGHGLPAAGPREHVLRDSPERIGDIHPGAAAIGLLSIAVLVVWDRWKLLKNSPVPAPLVVVLLGVGISLWFRQLGGRVGHRAEPPRASAGGRQPGRVPRVPAAARLLAVGEPGGVHRRRDDRRRRLAGNAAEPGGGR